MWINNSAFDKNTHYNRTELSLSPIAYYPNNWIMLFSKHRHTRWKASSLRSMESVDTDIITQQYHIHIHVSVCYRTARSTIYRCSLFVLCIVQYLVRKGPIRSIHDRKFVLWNDTEYEYDYYLVIIIRNSNIHVQ